MISATISEKVILIGPDYKTPKGGIGMVLKAYSSIYEVFLFITTHKECGALRKSLIFLKALLQLFPILVGKKIQVVHVHGASKGSFVRKSIVILLSKWSGKKVVYHIHGGGFKDFTKSHPKAVAYILKKCDTIVALSDSWKEFFCKEIGCKDVKVVPNIMEEPHEDHRLRDAHYTTLLFMGKICVEKGIFDLMDVIATHRDEYEGHIRLFIAGIGETERLLHIIKEYKLERIVSYKGWVSGQEKEQMLNMSDVYILPSYYEGVPISILEAFSYHLPVITTGVGGIPEILTDGANGLIVTPGDKIGLHNAIIRLTSSPTLRQKMGKVAYEKSLSHLPSNVETCLLSVYSPLLK